MMLAFRLTTTLLAGMLLHPVHETYCEMQWNAESKCVEVAVRFDVLDEQWIEKEYRPASADQDGSEKESTDWHRRFLKEQVVFDPVKRGGADSPASSAHPRWVGRKRDGAHVWWFFEIRRKDGKKPKNIQSSLLFERHPDYRHRVVILGEDGDAKSKAIILSRESPRSPIDL